MAYFPDDSVMQKDFCYSARFQRVKAMVRTLCIVLFTFIFIKSNAQSNEDSTQKNKASTNIFQAAFNAIKKSNVEPGRQAEVLIAKSEEQFLPHEGKIIRQVLIKEYGFERNFSDTSHGISYFGTRILNYLHKDTREWVIRNNLFIKPNQALNAYVLADNERYLRSLEYIQDARILVNVLPNNPDSVDVVVITKDLFSISADLNDISPNRLKARISEANLMGMGQKVQFTGLHDQSREPKFGYELLYSKNNIANTFINSTISYSVIRNDITDGKEDEQAFYLSFERPLVSQYSHVAGGITLGFNQSFNNYLKPESDFYKYRSNNFDAWVGYNLGVRRLLENNKRSDRKFVSIRYFQNNFLDVPEQVGDVFNLRYNDRQGLLGQFTFFKQKFYKTNYLYGFGTTEDIPYGYNIALTTGWYKQLQLKRPYAGIDANRYIVSNKGDLLQYFLRSGIFLNNGKIQDGSLLLGASLFSRLYLYKQVKFRQYIRMSITRQFNRVTYDPLKINNPFGLRYFNSDSAIGDRRFSLHSETFLFLKYKLFGFQFAPFAFADLTLLTPEKAKFSKTAFYSGLGGGVRTRNENLLFGTIELRLIYFPRSVENNNSFKATFTANLRFRYNTNYVKAPDLIQLNMDDANVIY